jgi:electron-transferring-flavoprotein dehydrogenase
MCVYLCVFLGFAADEVLYDDEGVVTGVATKDAGIAKDGEMHACSVM